MSAAPSNAVTRPQRARSALRFVIRSAALVAFGAVFAGAGFLAGWVYFAHPESPVLSALNALAKTGEENGGPRAPVTKDPEEIPQKEPLPTPEETLFATTYYTFPEPLMTNLSGSRRYLQLGVSFSTRYDAKVMEHVETHKAALQSDMLAVIGTLTEEDLKGPEGRERLGVLLRDAVNRRLEALEGFGGIENVFFPSFVMQ